MRPRTLIAALVALALLGAVAFGGYTLLNMLTKQALPWTDHCAATSGDWTVRLDPAQARNAAIIAGVAGRRGLPTQAVTIALATAYQESGIRNLDYGDRDSLGLFQQRPSYGWGTPEEILDPWYSANRFYEELVKFDNWDTIDVNDIAQKVQRSGHPEAYRKHETNARALAGALRGSREAALACLTFDRPPAAPEELTRLLASFGDAATPAWEGTTLSVSTVDAPTAWAVAQHLVANTYGAGVTEVTVADRQWRAGSKGWAEAREPVGDAEVRATLG